MAIFLVVMLPINALMVTLLFVPALMWMKISAGVLIALSCLGFFKNYVRRLIVSEQGVRFVRLGGSIEITWPQIRRIDRYIPGGGVGATSYVYITTHDREPEGRWESDADTIQLQDRPGLVEAIKAMKDRGNSR